MRDRLGIYIHIPFCVSKCSYCDFYSIAGGKQRMPDYQSALLSHISESAEAIESYEIDSIYIGGGTPSCYGAKRIVEILDELKRIGNVRLDSEITVEVNPDTTKLEEGTPMYRSYLGSPLIPDEDEQADMYLYTVDTLAHYGLKQYEISNFAIPGYESRHNLKYWQLGDYMGFGPGAHSCAGGVRYSYVRDLDRYVSAVVGDSMIIDEYEQIVPIQKATEYLMLGMRTTHGISEKEYHRIYRSDWEPIEETFELFERKGWAERDGERWHLTPAGFLISNVLINAVLEAQTGAKVENNPWMRDAFRQEKKQELPQGEYERFTSVYKDKLN